MSKTYLFFVNDETVAKKIKRDCYFYLLRTSDSSLANLFVDTSVEEYTLNIFYVINDFVKTIYNENYDATYFESADKVFQLYLYYLLTITKMHFNFCSSFVSLVIEYAMAENKLQILILVEGLNLDIGAIWLISLLKEVFVFLVIFNAGSMQEYLLLCLTNLSLVLILTSLILKLWAIIVFQQLKTNHESFSLPTSK